jgi:predicted nucleotidyltransferase
VRIFGSVARGEDTAQSDIDLLVDLEKGRTLLDLGGALVQLQDLLGRRVDIVTERGLHWYLREKILREARPL